LLFSLQSDKLNQRQFKLKEESEEKLQYLVCGFWMSHALFVVVQLGIADLLSDGPRRSDELALVTGTHAPSLYRLLRALASIGVFIEKKKSFALTPVSDKLRSDIPGSLRSFILAELSEEQCFAWENILYSVKTGRPARPHIPLFPSLQAGRHSPQPTSLDHGISNSAACIRAAVLHAYDFSHTRTLVDIGGDGMFLAFLLQAYESLRGVLVNYPQGMIEAHRRLMMEGVEKRSRTAAGDFFENPLPKGDLYLLNRMVCECSDERAAVLLKNCRRAMSSHSKLLLIEAVMPSDNQPSFLKLQDVRCLVSSGGRERTEMEFHLLLQQAGLQLKQVLAVCKEASVLEAMRR
jgi:hypothetical protein